MTKKAAIVRFKSRFEFMEYSYLTDIEDLKEGDIIVVPTNDSYSIGYFLRYSKDPRQIQNATKWIVQKVDIEAYEEKIFLGE